MAMGDFEMKNENYPYYVLPEIGSLWDMICQRSNEYKGKTAFAFRKGRKNIQTRSFRDVHDDVEKLGRYLKEKFPPSTHIAVIGENSYEWLMAFLSIAISGNVAVPVDKDLPENEVAKLLDQADVEAVFCSETYMDLVESVPREAVFSLKKALSMSERDVSETEGGYVGAGMGHTETVFPFDPDSSACIFFTSGTSGSPKAVMLSHANLAAEINGSCRLFKLEGDTLSVLPFHHSFGLIVGVLMVFNYGYSNFLNKSLKNIYEDMILAGPQTTFLVPLFVDLFYRQALSLVRARIGDVSISSLSGLSDPELKMGSDIGKSVSETARQIFGGDLQFIICGGAVLDPLYVREYRSMGIEILNGYGSTECSSCTSVNRNYYHKDGSVGIPIPGAEIMIAPDNEVLIKGPHVMTGYYNDRASTDEALRDGWYATGDLGEMDENGFLTITGRKKNLIITKNGENVSPEGLESDLAKDEAVREVLVYERDEVITAEIFPADDHAGDIGYFEELRRKVNSGRPVYKQIARIILRDREFEKSANKKIIRHRGM